MSLKVVCSCGWEKKVQDKARGRAEAMAHVQVRHKADPQALKIIKGA